MPSQGYPPEWPATITAPTRVMPLIAFEPDINGVCRVGGTLVMISKPTKIASTKIVSEAMVVWLREPRTTPC